MQWVNDVCGVQFARAFNLASLIICRVVAIDNMQCMLSESRYDLIVVCGHRFFFRC